MTDMVQHAGLFIDPALYTFINQEALPETGISSNVFWTRFAKVISDLSPENRALLEKRHRLQAQIDSFHRTNRAYSMDEYRTFLSEIGYLVDEPSDFVIATEHVEPEISITAAPQLVVPVSNARFALNAANARYGSLYDALYGTDVLSESDGAERTSNYNPVRGFKVMAYARQFLDSVLPLASGSHIESTSYAIVGGELIVTLRDSVQVYLAEPAQFVGFQGTVNAPTALLFKHNGLHIEILFDPFHPIGAADKAGIKDVVLEAAATTIMDCEDSVAAVDAEDKIAVYRNWLGLMKGTLSETFVKQEQEVTRSLNVDKQYTSKAGERITLKGRSMMFVRNVGHLMTNCAIFDSEGEPVFEGIMDAMITTLCAMHDLQGNSPFKNSTTASVNIVKPKMHGPEEVAFTNKLFAAVEDALELPRFTLKMGIMDEERRTSVNLKACIFEAKHRVVFINTGFLDRTGDEIHTSMLAGPVLPKTRIKAEPWISAYEDRNVDIGLKCGFSGKAQIGKGMWPIPDKMAMMMEQKIAHPQSGANTAWVPSPTAATLHALHYHQVRVFELQDILKSRQQASLDALLTPPLLGTMSLSKEDIQAELDNNAQGILGYVVRWIDQGIGCSKVPDINHVGLMEDRATLRISSQHIANWLFHGICSKAQVESTFAKMARVVDGQNADDPLYQPMATSDEALATNLAYQAALALVFEGTKQPNGYTEPLLHQFRLQKKTH